jgi:5-methylcytosine-specific restriction enzyme subunit McrC
VFENLLIDEKTGKHQFQDFLRDDRQMAVLFETFVRNFYLLEQSKFWVSSKILPWQNVEGGEGDLSFLPRMKTDISLVSPDREITIDTKYYASLFEGRFGPDKVRSTHLYQLFSYLKNLQVGTAHSAPIEGILLYPTVDRSVDLTYRIHGHPFRVATLNLNTGWEEIHQRLMSLLEPWSIAIGTPSTVGT